MKSSQGVSSASSNCGPTKTAFPPFSQKLFHPHRALLIGPMKLRYRAPYHHARPVLIDLPLIAPLRRLMLQPIKHAAPRCTSAIEFTQARQLRHPVLHFCDIRIDVGKIVFVCTREVGAEQDIQMAFVTVSHDHPFCSTEQKKGEPVKRDSGTMKVDYMATGEPVSCHFEPSL
jgi:hypothetical protein